MSWSEEVDDHVDTGSASHLDVGLARFCKRSRKGIPYCFNFRSSCSQSDLCPGVCGSNCDGEAGLLEEGEDPPLGSDVAALHSFAIPSESQRSAISAESCSRRRILMNRMSVRKPETDIKSEYHEDSNVLLLDIISYSLAF